MASPPFQSNIIVTGGDCATLLVSFVTSQERYTCVPCRHLGVRTSRPFSEKHPVLGILTPDSTLCLVLVSFLHSKVFFYSKGECCLIYLDFRADTNIVGGGFSFFCAQGPEIRTGFLADGKKTAELKRGGEIELTTDYDFLGDSTKVQHIQEEFLFLFWSWRSVGICRTRCCFEERDTLSDVLLRRGLCLFFFFCSRVLRYHSVLSCAVCVA